MGLRSRKVVNKNRGQATSFLSLTAAESGRFSGHSLRQAERSRKGRKKALCELLTHIFPQFRSPPLLSESLDACIS